MKKIFLFVFLFLLATLSFANRVPERGIRVFRAQQLQAKLDRINQFIPNLTPEQIDYVAMEQAEIDRLIDRDSKFSRLAKFEETKEAQIAKVKNFLRSGDNALLGVVENEGSSDQEMLLWMTFVSYFIDSNMLSSAIAILERDGVLSQQDIKKMGLLKGSFGYGQFLAWDAKAVLDEIIIPFQIEKVASTQDVGKRGE